jgi:predicted metal-dependent hydrolase
MHSIRYGDAQIAFTIRLPSRRRRGVAISVMPDGAVIVDAPEDAAPDEVAMLVSRRARWIWQQLQAQRERGTPALPREYVSGESHAYLGRRYLLKIAPCTGTVPGVRLARGKLEVRADRQDRDTIERLLDAWYRERAQEVFAGRITEQSARCGWLQAPPAFGLREMRTQWGSCSPQQALLLNPRLVKAPLACVDYVIVHELCHLKEHNHSPRFYRLLTAMLPDWEQRKSELDGMAQMLLAR